MVPVAQGCSAVLMCGWVKVYTRGCMLAHVCEYVFVCVRAHVVSCTADNLCESMPLVHMGHSLRQVGVAFYLSTSCSVFCAC